MTTYTEPNQEINDHTFVMKMPTSLRNAVREEAEKMHVSSALYVRMVLRDSTTGSANARDQASQRSAKRKVIRRKRAA